MIRRRVLIIAKATRTIFAAVLFAVVAMPAAASIIHYPLYTTDIGDEPGIRMPAWYLWPYKVYDPGILSVFISQDYGGSFGRIQWTLTGCCTTARVTPGSIIGPDTVFVGDFNVLFDYWSEWDLAQPDPYWKHGWSGSWAKPNNFGYLGFSFRSWNADRSNLIGPYYGWVRVRLSEPSGQFDFPVALALDYAFENVPGRPIRASVPEPESARLLMVGIAALAVVANVRRRWKAKR